MSDDGGSSGRLRKELNVPPPGDIRNCIVALSEKEALLSRLVPVPLQSRRRTRRPQLRQPVSLGDDRHHRRLQRSGETCRRAFWPPAATSIPATTSNAQLYAIMDDGSVVRGETNITASQRRITELRMAPANAKPAPAALEAIETADLITIGPGSLFTSLVPNLLVRDLSKAIKNSRATKVYVCNLMTQANESLNLTASQHILAIYKHARHEFFDYALVNQTPASPATGRRSMPRSSSRRSWWMPTASRRWE